MSFRTHLDNICKKASNKIQALGRVTQYMSLPKKKLLFNSFFKSQFNYCPLVWMCHNRGFNNRINRLHERCLRITYNDKTSSFQELLEKDGSTSIHDHNLQTLATEMFKVLKGISPVIISNIFQQRKSDRYEFRQNSCFILPSVNSVHNGTETVRYLGPKIWELVPSHIKEIDSLMRFKKEIKNWKPENCPCRLCKNYIPGIGFM